jgi:hypothetical protein
MLQGGEPVGSGRGGADFPDLGWRPGSGSVTGLVVHQPVAGVPAVDEAEVGGGLVEAEEFLEAPRELADLRVAGAVGVCRG